MRNLFFIAALLCTAINIASAQTAVGKQPNAVPTNPICRFQKIYENDQLFYSVRYNTAGHVQESKEYKNGQLKTHRIIVRADAEGRILEARLVDSIEKKIFVNKFTRDAAGFVLTRERFEVTKGDVQVLVERSVYENNPASPCVITKITRYDGNGNLVDVTTMENLDAKGSSKSVVTDKAGKVTKTEVWKRDDKISGRQFVDAFPYQWIHNRIEYTVTNADGTLDPTSNKDENRVFNAQGYTTSVTVRYADGHVSNFRYEYECQ
jgi:hypothetical protein